MSAASVKCTDLRGGVATVLAGLQAKGRTKVTNIEYILRGYENLDKNLINQEQIYKQKKVIK